MELTLTNLKRDFKLIKKRNSQAAERILALVEFVKIEHQYARRRHLYAKKIRLYSLCEGLDITLRTLFRWRAAYLKKGVAGLVNKRKRGRVATPLKDETKELIEEMRKKYRWGSEVMQAHLKYDHGIVVTRYKIEKYLSLSGLRDEYPCSTKKTKMRKLKRHTKKVKIDHPGEHTQMDTKHLPGHLGKNKRCYVFNFVDHASNWSFKYAYSRVTPEVTEDFLKRLEKVCPFEIRSIQTDHGREFTYKFFWKMTEIKKEHPLEKFCKANDIHHRLIVPGEKELQGLVERSHRQDDQEFYIRMEPMELIEFNRHLTEYCVQRNASRRFKKLDWKTPLEWLEIYSRKDVSGNIDQNLDIVTFKTSREKASNYKEIEKKDDRKGTKRAA